jgi:hypothetical protein
MISEYLPQLQQAGPVIISLIIIEGLRRLVAAFAAKV